MNKTFKSKPYAAHTFEVEMFREDETEMASVIIWGPFDQVWSGGEYAIDMNEFEDDDGYPKTLHPKVYDRLVEFVESCRYRDWDESITDEA